MIDTTKDMRDPAVDWDAQPDDDGLRRSRTVKLDLTNLVVMVYKSSQHEGWNTHVAYDATDVETGERGGFGSVNQYPAEPTPAEIVEHVVDQLRHEVEEQLGLRPHGSAT